MSSDLKLRDWCFTLNNYRDEDELSLIAQNYTYLVWGYEIGEQGTPHLQGYVEFPRARALASLKKVCPKVHWEGRRGTQEQAIQYCKKDGNFKEFGSRKQPGKRSDLSGIAEATQAGTSIKDMFGAGMIHDYQQLKFAESCRRYLEGGRSWPMEVLWYYGPTGSGKTRAAYELAPNAYWSLNTGRWWDGYDGHSDIIIDEFRGDFITYHGMLRLLDRYPYVLETKGGTRQMLARRVIITSCYHPTEVYQTIEEKEQLLRRITEIKYFGDPQTNPLTSPTCRGFVAPVDPVEAGPAVEDFAVRDV